MTHHNHGESLDNAQAGDTLTNGYGETLTVVDTTKAGFWLICEHASGREVLIKRDTSNAITAEG